jgi:hypothetical protein
VVPVEEQELVVMVLQVAQVLAIQLLILLEQEAVAVPQQLVEMEFLGLVQAEQVVLEP